MFMWVPAQSATRNGPFPDNQRIRVPEETVMQIDARDAHGNKMLMLRSGPVDISMVPVEWEAGIRKPGGFCNGD
jgi:hypothetical protein